MLRKQMNSVHSSDPSSSPLTKGHSGRQCARRQNPDRQWRVNYSLIEYQKCSLYSVLKSYCTCSANQALLWMALFRVNGYFSQKPIALTELENFLAWRCPARGPGWWLCTGHCCTWAGNILRWDLAWKIMLNYLTCAYPRVTHISGIVATEHF